MTQAVAPDTERAVRDFVRLATENIALVISSQTPDWGLESKWLRGSDGHFREQTKRSRKLWPILDDEWLHSQPEYETVVSRMKADPVVGAHLDRLVGTNLSAQRMDADRILLSAIYAMTDSQGALSFSDERFDCKWREFVGCFTAEQIAQKTVSPLPGLLASDFPLRLNNELVLDRLNEQEVTRCHQVGVLRPDSPQFPLIFAEVAVGIRRTLCLPKSIRGDNVSPLPVDGESEGRFGFRPPLRDDLVVDDVLSALRLFKRTGVRSAGYASWTDSVWLTSGTSFRVLRQWPYGGECKLSETELPQFLELWRTLEDGASRFGFSIHRFNLAFDRGLLADRIVDLVIAAESLFLGDLDEKYRGELRYRFALRAAKFIEHPSYSEREVFRVMRAAYDARSAIVHGGTPKEKEIRLPGNDEAKLPEFTDAVEELLRLGLRKALTMKAEAQRLRQSGFWDDLVFQPDSLE